MWLLVNDLTVANLVMHVAMLMALKRLQWVVAGRHMAYKLPNHLPQF